MRRRKTKGVNVDAKEVERIYKMVAAIWSASTAFEREFGASNEFALTQGGQDVSPKVDRFSHLKWTRKRVIESRWRQLVTRHTFIRDPRHVLVSMTILLK